MSTAVFSEVTADPRLARRRMIRLRMAEKDLIVQRRREIENAIRNLDAELDHATNAHQSTCEPIQIEISELERKRSSLVADRQSVPESIDIRRRELLDSLREANNELEKAATDHRERTAVLQKEIKTIAESEKRYSDLTPFALQHPSVANPHLADLHWCAMRSIEFANHRVRAAQEKISTYQAEIARLQSPRALVAGVGTIGRNGESVLVIDSGQIQIYQDRLRRWKLELDAAGKSLADANAESERIRQLILDE